MADDKRLKTDLNAPDDATRKRLPPGQTFVPPTPDPRWGVEGCCVREFWAVIENDGTLVRGRNVVWTNKLGTGIYEVFFTGEVSNGAYVATIGRPGIFTEPPGEITVALRCCPGGPPLPPFSDNKGVWIQTFDSSGQPADRAFHLIVLTQ